MSQISIIQGEKRDVNIYLSKKVSCDQSRPFDLTGATEVEVQFPGTSAVVSKKLTTSGVSIEGDETLGHLLVPLSKTDTANLKAGIEQDITVIVDFGSTNRRICNIKAALDVETESV